jgi:hydrogenase maturation protease
VDAAKVQQLQQVRRGDAPNGVPRFGFEERHSLGHSAPEQMTTQSHRPPAGLLVIGYGNTLRSDDGVGPRVADAVAALVLPDVRALAVPLLTPELADPVSQARVVILVDAAVDAPREVQLRKLAPADTSQIMAHSASPATLLALARDVFGYAPEAWLLTIPAENIGIGEEISVFTRRGLQTAIEEIKKLARNG